MDSNTCDCGKSIPPDEWICVDCEAEREGNEED